MSTLAKGHRTCRRGFTLAELLVVIAIFALLAGVLFPIVQNSIQRAQKNACMSNLRQLGVATLLYTQDHDGELPYSRSDSGKWWFESIEPYLANIPEVVATPVTYSSVPLRTKRPPTARVRITEKTSTLTHGRACREAT